MIRSTWAPPPLPDDEAPEDTAGTLGGTRLYEQPAHAAQRDAALAFAARPGPLVIEVGFDHGMRLLDAARAHPDVRFLGLELRKARVEAVAPHAPPNAFVWRADARAVLGAVWPAGTAARVEVFFPTPTEDPRRLLFRPGFVRALARVLQPDGVLHLRTDVGPYAAWVGTRLPGWSAVAPPPALTGTLSRRERVCRRDGLPVFEGAWSPPKIVI
jgi:tRNA G46 methylase TrmB